MFISRPLVYSKAEVSPVWKSIKVVSHPFALGHFDTKVKRSKVLKGHP